VIVPIGKKETEIDLENLVVEDSGRGIKLHIKLLSDEETKDPNKSAVEMMSNGIMQVHHIFPAGSPLLANLVH
jgi:hypothetical protein